MAGFTMDYGKKELSLIERYANYGCVLNNEVDYGCVSSHPTEDDEAIALEVTESAMNLQDALDDCADNLFYYLYKMDDLVYEGEDVNIDEE